ncbi:hypothetical protein BVC80_67g16 [Macleaya cordata]|uniref:Ovarian tumor n=1 Tax=Macleaya cordata TaxID=56857 RepID=A0A200QX32_MACCD|nr:hypothetical protein BVC80_67g16 [Macleaya cordata]
MEKSIHSIKSIDEQGNRGASILDEDSWLYEAVEGEKASGDHKSPQTPNETVPNFVRDDEDILGPDSLSLLQCYASDSDDKHEKPSLEEDILNNEKDGWDCTHYFDTDKIFYSREELTSWCKAIVRDSFAKSLNSSMHAHRISDFNNLRGFISRSALNILLLEKKKGEQVGIEVAKCGCVLKRTHGIPCAHEVTQYKREGRGIPLTSIHQRWRQLSDVPMNISKRSLDCTRVISLVRNRFEDATEEQQCMLLRGLLELAQPSTTNMEQPSTNVIRKGRPSNKKASSQAKNNTKRDPSPVGSAHTGKEQTTQQSSTTSKRRTREPTKNIVCKRRRTILQLKDLTEEELFEEVLDLFDPKIKEHIIERLENVAPDGHCGYRCCAELLNMSKDDGWKNVRQGMLDELRDHRDLYMTQLGGRKNYKKVVRALNYFISTCSKKYWMQFPELGCLFATTFNCVLCVLDPKQYTTYLPLRIGPINEPNIISIVLYDDIHFLKAFLKPNAPIPKVVLGWDHLRYPDANEWKNYVSHKFAEWEALIGYPPI